jgi:hypothetical protein
MRGKTLSTYAAVFIITLFGAAATLLIVDTAHSVADVGMYAGVDPFDPNADYSGAH